MGTALAGSPHLATPTFIRHDWPQKNLAEAPSTASSKD